VSVMMSTFGRLEARVVWVCAESCLEIVELATQDAHGELQPINYVVNILGEGAVYESASLDCATQYRDMLVGV